MKTKLMIAAVAGMMILASCSKNSNDLSNASVQAAAQAVSASGTWKVTSYIDNSDNETAEFNGYSFTFNSNGTIVATAGSVNVNGSWSTSSSSNKFIINLGPKGNTNKPLGELTDDWRVISASSTQIQLKDDNNAEFVTFSKF
jgi:hypothetical protein